MLKTILYASAALALLAAPSLADNSVTITLQGTVDAKCSITTGIGATLMLGTFDTNADGTYSGETIDRPVDGSAWCNGVTNDVVAVAKPMMNVDLVGAAPSGFTNRVDYELTLTFLGQSFGSLDTVGADPANGREVNASGLPAFSEGGSGTGHVTTVGSGADKLIAGNYQGEVTITLVPHS